MRNKNKKNISHASSIHENQAMQEKLLVVDAFQTALRSKPYIVSIDQQILEGHTPYFK